MNVKLEDEDYWNSSATTGFSFDDDEGTSVLNLFQSSKISGTSKRPELSFVGIFNDFTEPQGGIKPLESLISKRSTALILGEEVRKKGAIDSKEELSLLKKQLTLDGEARPVSATIRLIQLGKPCSLHLYRSLEAKTQLLDEAVKSYDGNAILQVVLYLNKTLKKTLFGRLLQLKPVAVLVYINYLTIRFERKAAVELLQLFGHHRSAALKDFQSLIQSEQSLDKRLQNLKFLSRDHFTSADIADKIFVDNFLKFVDWQVNSAARNSNTSGTVAGALSYLCSNHWKDVQGQPLSPITLTILLGVCERIFHWKAITARASAEGWDDINGLLLTKGWLGAKKLKTVITAERIVVELHRLRAPEHVLTEYLGLIESLEKQLDLARKLAWHRTAIDTLTKMRDRQALVQYQATLNPQSNDFLHAEISLHAANVKWKN